METQVMQQYSFLDSTFHDLLKPEFQVPLTKDSFNMKSIIDAQNESNKGSYSSLDERSLALRGEKICKSYEPMYKVVRLSQEKTVLKHKEVCVTRVSRVIKTFYTNRPQNQSNPNKGNNETTISLDHIKKIRPALYKLLTTLKDPNSIRKVQETLQLFARVELMEAVKGLQGKEKGKEAEEKEQLEANLEIMDKLIKSTEIEDKDQILFDSKEEVEKMLNEFRTQ